MSKLLEPAQGIDIEECVKNYGTPCSVEGIEKDEYDLHRYELAIEAAKPDMLVETGTNTGRSANWFADRVPFVVTIDITHERILFPARENVTRLLMDSIDLTAAEYVQDMAVSLKAKRIMVSLDSNHTVDHVHKEIAVWADVVTTGQYLVVEDTLYHWKFPDSPEDPLKAISLAAPFLEIQGFKRDLDIEGHWPLTGNMCGWWRRG